MCGNKRIAFDKLEIFSRNKKSIKSRFIHFKKIGKLKSKEKIKVKKDLKKNYFKKKKFYI